MFLGSLLKSLAGPAMLASAGAFYYANRIEPRSYRLESIDVTTYGGDPAAGTAQHSGISKLKILHLSDLHLCYPETDKIDFLRRITNQDYDLIVLTGDIFENYSGMAYARSIVATAPRLGAYAVLGNHDYYNYTLVNKVIGRIVRKFRHPQAKRNVEPMIRALESGGIRVLRQQAIDLPEHGVHLVGIDYPSLNQEELTQLVGLSSPGHLRLVLFHVPIHLSDISAAGAHLALGGHTHGGQIRIPGLGAIITDSELPGSRASGLFWIKQTAFHISRGLGADPRSNIRLFCPPAATAINVTHHRGVRCV